MKILSLMKLQMTGLLKFGDGTIKVFNQRFGMLPISFYYLLSLYFDNINKKKDLYLISWINGILMMKYFELSTNAKHPIDLYTIGMEYASFVGSGKFKTLEYDIGNFAKFQIENEPFLEYKNEKPESPYLIVAGFQAGGGTVSHRNIINCLPLSINKENKIATFLNATKEEMIKRNLLEKFESFIQGKIDEVLPLQQEVYQKILPVTKIEELKKIERYELNEIFKHIRC